MIGTNDYEALEHLSDVRSVLTKDEPVGGLGIVFVVLLYHLHTHTHTFSLSPLSRPLFPSLSRACVCVCGATKDEAVGVIESLCRWRGVGWLRLHFSMKKTGKLSKVFENLSRNSVFFRTDVEPLLVVLLKVFFWIWEGLAFPLDFWPLQCTRIEFEFTENKFFSDKVGIMYNCFIHTTSYNYVLRQLIGKIWKFPILPPLATGLGFVCSLYFIYFSRDGMRCRSDWPRLCLSCCYQPLCVVSQQSWFWSRFFSHKLPILPPPTQTLWVQVKTKPNGQFISMSASPVTWTKADLKVGIWGILILAI